MQKRFPFLAAELNQLSTVLKRMQKNHNKNVPTRLINNWAGRNGSSLSTNKVIIMKVTELLLRNAEVGTHWPSFQANDWYVIARLG